MPQTARVVSIDAFRGFVMWMIASAGMGLGALSDDERWGRVGRWFHHVPWNGIVFWDTIQPSFTFIAGVSLGLALDRRARRGERQLVTARWLAVRALKLVTVSQLLIAMARGEVLLQLIDSLSQIAIALLLVFAISRLWIRWQVVAGCALLELHWAAHALWPAPDGVWSPNDPVGLRIDRFVFGWSYYDGAYSTFNVVSSAVYALVGLWVARLLLSRPSPRIVLIRLAGGAAVAWTVGLILTISVPMVKQLSTPSFVMVALGWVLAMMAVAHALFDVALSPRWATFLTVIGRNAILVYGIDLSARWWFEGNVRVFSGGFEFLGRFGPVADELGVGLAIWMMCWWLHRRNVSVTI